MFTNPAFDLDWNLVRTFVAVSNGGSLAAGARELGITHPTAARHIQMLEEGLGTALFTRSGRGLVLNDMGQALQRSAAQMHASAIALQSHINSLRQGPLKQLRIAVSDVLAEMLPGLMFGRFERQRELTVDLVVGNDVVNLLAGEADIAVRHVRPHQQDLVCRRIGVLPMGAYAHRCYVERVGELAADRLHEHAFIDGLARDSLTRGAAKRGIVLDPQQIAFRSDSLACQRAAVNAGWGIGVLPQWMAAEEPDWVELLTDEIMNPEVWLVARPEVRDQLALKEAFTSVGQALEAGLSS